MTDTGPLVLAFDTSQSACDLTLLSGQGVLAHVLEPMSKGQAEQLLPLCAEIMKQAGVVPADLVAVGVGVGPGNFTGVRISVSAARGLSLGLGIPAVGVSAFEALQFGAADDCCASVDARRNQVYTQTFVAGMARGAPQIIERSALSDISFPIVGVGGCAPRHPASVAIAHLAKKRYTTSDTRPAPLYIRPADAAPAKDGAPPVLS